MTKHAIWLVHWLQPEVGFQEYGFNQFVSHPIYWQETPDFKVASSSQLASRRKSIPVKNLKHRMFLNQYYAGNWSIEMQTEVGRQVMRIALHLSFVFCLVLTERELSKSSLLEHLHGKALNPREYDQPNNATSIILSSHLDELQVTIEGNVAPAPCGKLKSCPS